MKGEKHRRACVFTYLGGNADFYMCQYKNDTIILDEHSGGMYGDPYAGMEIKDGTLRIYEYGGSSYRWEHEFVFVRKEKRLILQQYIETNSSTLTENSIQDIWNYEEGTFETYAMTLDDKYLVNKGTYDPETIGFEDLKWEDTYSSNRNNLSAMVFGLPSLEIDHYDFMGEHDIYKGSMDTHYSAEEALDMVMEAKYPNMHKVSIVCEEEILDNYETLLGYKPPGYYYEDKKGNKLWYGGRENSLHKVNYLEADVPGRYMISHQYILSDISDKIEERNY